MTRCYLLFLLGLLLLGCSASDDDVTGGGVFSPSDRPPNVVLIVADDLGWFDLASYGNDFIETPNLDRLAAAGIRFTNGYAAAAICSPSRSSLLTGLTPVATNITEHIHGNGPPRPGQQLRTPPIAQQLALNFRTTGEVFRERGYGTAYIGKWHLGGGEFQPQFQGFDYTIGSGANGLPQSFFYPFFPPNQHQRLRDSAEPGDYLTDVLTDRALDYIDAHQDSSFFVNLNYYAPHVPIMGKEELIEKYRQKRAGSPNDSFPDIVYAAMVDAIDQNVGRIMDRLDALGLTDNTLVVFTSDNGGLHVEEVPAFAAHTPPTDNGPLRAGKGYLYEGGTRVPLIVRWPARVSAGQVSDTPVVGEDIFPALQDPTGMSPLFGDASTDDRLLIWHFPHYSPQGGKPASSLRQGNLKLVYDYETERSMLFDLAADPGETTDLSATEPEKARELEQLLKTRLADMGAQLPTSL